MEQTLPRTCGVHFEDPNKLHKFMLMITPEDGYWYGGKYRFHVEVPEDYNIVVSVQQSFIFDVCSTRVLHET